MITILGIAMIVLPILIFLFLIIASVVADAMDGDFLPLIIMLFLGCPIVGLLLLRINVN